MAEKAQALMRGSASGLLDALNTRDAGVVPREEAIVMLFYDLANSSGNS